VGARGSRPGFTAKLSIGIPAISGIWVQYVDALKEFGGCATQTSWRKRRPPTEGRCRLDPGLADRHLQLGHVLKPQGKTKRGRYCAVQPPR
jgi:hypothetical protein